MQAVGVPAADYRDFYGGAGPYDAPAYRVADAARFLHLPPSTLRWWVLGGEYRTQGGIDKSPPIIDLADPARRLLSFRNLVEAHHLSALRREHNVYLAAIREAVKVLRDRYNTSHPLADHRLETDGTNVFIRTYGHLANLNDINQGLLQGILDRYVKRVTWNREGELVELHPFARDLSDESRKVAINPLRGFGLPSIEGTGIRTAVIADRFRGGDTVQILAQDYGRPEDEIVEALRYEQAA